MFDLTTLDYVYIGAILVSTIWASVRGGVYETVATLSWVVAAIAARFASPWLDGVLQSWFGLSDSTVGTLIASYFIVFFVILLLVGFVNQRLRDKIQDSMMRVTDRTLGIIFGIIRGIVVMGFAYWGALWYYSDTPFLPQWIENARTRPIMQYTAEKLDEWFIPGAPNKLLERDRVSSAENMKIFKNLINPAVSEKSDDVAKPSVDQAHNPGEKTDAPETGYKSSERTALENQLLQIESAARAEEQREAAQEDEVTE